MIYFIPGAQPQLSLAEIHAVLQNQLQVVRESQGILLGNMEHPDFNALQNRLAGTVKMGNIIEEQKTWNGKELAEILENNLSTLPDSQKIQFGISIHDLGTSSRAREKMRAVHAIGLEVKKRLRREGRSVRFVSSREPALSSVIIETNHVLSSGGEYVFFLDHAGVLIGRTQTIQDFQSWSRRDYERPARDPRSGMLPPKLARMMINLSGLEPQGKTILDPFCGSGTVLMEAALMGFGTLVGGDASQRAVQHTAQNLTWLAKTFHLPPPDLHLYTSEASDLPRHWQKKADVLVTEVYLGPPRHTPLKKEEWRDACAPLLSLYETSFDALKKNLAPQGKAVVAFPLFKQKNGEWRRLDIEPVLRKLGYVIEDEFLYYRPDQLVGRQILVLHV